MGLALDAGAEQAVSTPREHRGGGHAKRCESHTSAPSFLPDLLLGADPEPLPLGRVFLRTQHARGSTPVTHRAAAKLGTLRAPPAPVDGKGRGAERPRSDASCPRPRGWGASGLRPNWPRPLPARCLGRVPARQSPLCQHRLVWASVCIIRCPLRPPGHLACSGASAPGSTVPSERFANRASISLLLRAALGPGSCSGALEE